MTNTSKSAIVTGAARGIGSAIATRLARDGWDVAVFDLDPEQCQTTVKEIEEAGRRGLAVAMDVTNEDAVNAAVDRVADTLGAPLVLVNNAGITRDNLLFKMSLDEWESVMAVHLKGAFLMSRAVQRHMTNESWGRIVNVSSTSALGNRGQSNYSAAKAGIQGLTKTLAIELGRFGVTVNAVAPGFIVTDMTVATAARIGISFEQHKEEASARIPVGRVGEPDDVAGAVAFFVGGDASFVSGQVLYVAGGPRS